MSATSLPPPPPPPPSISLRSSSTPMTSTPSTTPLTTTTEVQDPWDLETELNKALHLSHAEASTLFQFSRYVAHLAKVHYTRLPCIPMVLEGWPENRWGGLNLDRGGKFVCGVA